MADPDGGRSFEDADNVVGVKHLTDVTAVRFLTDAEDIHERVGNLPVHDFIVVGHGLVATHEFLVVHQEDGVSGGVIHDPLDTGCGVYHAVWVVVLVLEGQYQQSVDRLFEGFFKCCYKFIS